MDDVLQHGIELGRSFIQPRYWGRRGLDYLWSGIGAYLARYPHYRYLFGPVSISGGLPPAARDLLVAFYRMWFPATHPLAESRRPYPASLPDVLAQFGGEDYNDDLARLKSLLGNLGCAIPRCISSTRKCASRAACSLSISAAIRFQQLRGWSGAGGSHLPEGQSLPALYWRASGCAKIGIKLFPACGALRLSRAMVHRFRRFGSPEKARQAPPPKAAGNVLRGLRLMP